MAFELFKAWSGEACGSVFRSAALASERNGTALFLLLYVVGIPEITCPMLRSLGRFCAQPSARRLSNANVRLDSDVSRPRQQRLATRRMTFALGEWLAPQRSNRGRVTGRGRILERRIQKRFDVKVAMHA